MGYLDALVRIELHPYLSMHGLYSIDIRPPAELFSHIISFPIDFVCFVRLCPQIEQ
jgi:hypothetical protein